MSSTSTSPRVPPPSFEQPREPPRCPRIRSPPPIPIPTSPSPSLADRRTMKPRPVSTRLEPVLEGDGRHLNARESHKPATPGPSPSPGFSPVPGSGDGSRRRGSAPHVSRQRSQYYELAFSLRGGGGQEETSVRSTAMILVEMKTNVLINDEAAFITDLCDMLSKRYQRPPTSIVVILEHTACMFFAGSFESAYVLAVHALPSLVQTVTNRRNVALIQRHLEGMLRVPSTRGLVRFVGVPEECLGYDGKTIAGELAGLEDASAAPESLESRIQRRRAMRTMSRLKHGSSHLSMAFSGNNINHSSNRIMAAEQHRQRRASLPLQLQHQPVGFQTFGGEASSRRRSGSQSQPETRSTEQHQQQSSSPPPQGVKVNEHRKSKSLGHRRSFNFIQAFFKIPKKDGDAKSTTISG